MSGPVETMTAPPPRLDDPPKSYADAAIEPPPQTNGVQQKRTDNAHSSNGQDSSGALDSSPSTPPRLDDPDKSYAQAAVERPPQSNGQKLNGMPVKSPGEYEGSGILEAPPQSPTKSSFRRPRAKGSRSSLRGKSMSTTSLNSEDTLYESYHHNGQLTSIKPTDDYELNLAQDEKERKPIRDRKSTKGEQELEIASGRIAAAGWERSGYVVWHLGISRDY